jgi:hypothetical protein
LRAYFGQERFDVALFKVGVEESPIEIAVITDCGTEGDVDVEAKHAEVGELVN